MRNGDFVENEHVKKCPKVDVLIEDGPSGRLPRSKMTSKYIPEQSPNIPHNYPCQKHPKSAKIALNRCKIIRIEQKIRFVGPAWGLVQLRLTLG